MKEAKEKVKLTLGIERGIRKAEEDDINISEITEQLLKVITYTNNNEMLVRRNF